MSYEKAFQKKERPTGEREVSAHIGGRKGKDTGPKRDILMPGWD